MGRDGNEAGQRSGDKDVSGAPLNHRWDNGPRPEDHAVHVDVHDSPITLVIHDLQRMRGHLAADYMLMG